MIQAINIVKNNQARKNSLNFCAPRYAITFTSSVSPIANVQMPTADRNYCIFDQNRVNYFASQKEHALPYIKKVLQTSKDEKEIVEALYILNCMIENGTKGIPAMYPILARFNNTKSPNIQVFLAGIYRKIQVPDAFGPLFAMLIRNSLNPSPLPSPTRGEGESNNLNCIYPPFDPNEEIGGAILEYIKNYSNNPKKIDYSA